MRTTGRARRGTRATTACRWRQRVVPRDAGHRGQRVLSRLSGRERGTFASRLIGQDSPGLSVGLPDVGPASPGREKAVDLLIAVRGAAGGVEMHAVLDRLGIRSEER